MSANTITPCTRLWRLDADTIAAFDGRELRGLGDEERARAESMPAASERRARFVRQRHAMRAALAACTGAEPSSLRLGYGSHGKPHLLAPHADWQFSLSHSGSAAVLAATRDGPVGIDLERVRKEPRDELAQRLLGAAAMDVYRTLGNELRCEAFAWAWAEREAYVKALGLGIGDGWERVARLFAAVPLTLQPAAGETRVAAGWTLSYLDAFPGFACVLCSAEPPDDLAWAALEVQPA